MDDIVTYTVSMVDFLGRRCCRCGYAVRVAQNFGSTGGVAPTESESVNEGGYRVRVSSVEDATEYIDTTTCLFYQAMDACVRQRTTRGPSGPTQFQLF